MAIFSKLSSVFASSTARARFVNQYSKRFSHGRNLVVEGSMYTAKKTYDLIHFYLSIGLLTSLPVIIWFNLTQAPAELADIPEGYEPEFWEYDKHPIRRWVAKTFYSDPRLAYERHLTDQYLLREEEFVMRLKTRIQNIMRRKQDSASWFYAPIDRSVSRTIIEDVARNEAEGIIQAPSFGYHLEGPDPAADYQGVQEAKRFIPGP